MQVFYVCLCLASFATFSLSTATCAAEENEHPWALVGYGSIYTPDRLKDVLVNRHSYQDSYLGVLAVSRELARTGASLSWEGEGQVGKYFGRQSHFEYNALVVGRWHRFPWNQHMTTTFAVGEGVSWATRIPRLEAKNHEHASQLLNYLLFEVTLSHPLQNRWYWSGRIHHRSGVFGLFNGVHGGSNFVGMGVGYRF